MLCEVPKTRLLHIQYNNRLQAQLPSTMGTVTLTVEQPQQVIVNAITSAIPQTPTMGPPRPHIGSILVGLDVAWTG